VFVNLGRATTNSFQQKAVSAKHSLENALEVSAGDDIQRNANLIIFLQVNCIFSRKLIAYIHGWFFTVQLCCLCAPIHPRCKVKTRYSTPAAVMAYAACRVQTRLGTALLLYSSEKLYDLQTSLHGEVLGPTFCASADIFECTLPLPTALTAFTVRSHFVPRNPHFHQLVSNFLLNLLRFSLVTLHEIAQPQQHPQTKHSKHNGSTTAMRAAVHSYRQRSCRRQDHWTTKYG
jgi:hypothetical protein